MEDKDKQHPIKTTMIEDTFELTMGSIRIKRSKEPSVLWYIFMWREMRFKRC